MALDNIELDNLQAGDDVITDLIATDHYQIVKHAFGAAGTANLVTSTATNPLPVALSDVDNAVLDVIAADTTSIDGKVTACNTGAVVLAAGTAEVGKLAAGVAEIGNVKNSGTFATQADATLQAETTKVIGTVRMASGGVASGSFASGALASGAVTDLPLPSGAATSANQVAKATGGMSYDQLALAAEDNDKIIKGSAGTLYFISAQSIDATPVYLKFFDAASITPGTTSADFQFIIPSQGDANGAGLTLNFGPHGIQMATGIVALVATGIALDNNTAVSANEVVVTIGFE